MGRRRKQLKVGKRPLQVRKQLKVGKSPLQVWWDTLQTLAKKSLKWLIKNKPWVFSGIGCSILVACIGFLIAEPQKPAGNYKDLAKEYGVTETDIKNFLKILGKTQMSTGDLDNTLRKLAEKYEKLEKKGTIFSSDDPAVVFRKEEAQKAWYIGDYERVERLLNEASTQDMEAAIQLHDTEVQRRLSAAACKADNGTLKEMQLAYGEAATYYRQAVELVPQGADEILATYLNEWGRASYEAGNYAGAELPLTRSLDIRKQILKSEHRDVATSLYDLATLYSAQARYAEAEPLFRRAIAIWEKVLGPQHPAVATTLRGLAMALLNQGKGAEVEPLLRRSWDISQKVFGSEPLAVAASLNDLALFYRDQNRAAEAEMPMRRSLDISQKVLGSEHPTVATSFHNLALLYYAQGKYKEAVPLFPGTTPSGDG